MHQANWQYVGEEKTEIPHVTKHVWNLIGTGACQCYGDCDCYKDRGKFLGQVFKYSHPFATYSNGGIKKYETLEACLQSLKSKTS